ncbi:MAG: hypothetical protein KDA27_24960 [Candidatus Eisenbacteria bacterium]|uniref:Cellobiose phosphorylase n=1 Tax=Eiseniibacteriota bacterium TaxID=2212470 RepID=A0A956SFQ9_UNCEI|nr:hypothetical protein [Candidatus Eisenbacteria bacterium]
MSGIVPSEVQSRSKSSPSFVERGGDTFYRIDAFDQMPPFLVNLPSDTDIWMFLSSAGGITAGRVSAEQSLFPYETVDRLHRAHSHTGAITLVRTRSATGLPPWEPLTEDAGRRFHLTRTLYKNTTGNVLVFEETNHDLGLLYEQSWSSCDEFGIVRTVRLQNVSSTPVRIEVLDGLRNILPYGVPLSLYQTSSYLVDAYKRADLDPASGLGIYSLTARIVDRPEASEVLRANAVWCHGLDVESVSLSDDAIVTFRQGGTPRTTFECLGRQGCYLVASREIDIDPGSSIQWRVLADTALDHEDLARLRSKARAPETLDREIDQALLSARDNLRRIVASSDGLQRSADTEATAHHFTSVLFNEMRGGVFARNHTIPREDFRRFVETRNRAAGSRMDALVDSLPPDGSVDALVHASRDTGDPDSIRLALEYLPLYFGRRHGDPSRPWNRFELRMKGEHGGRVLHYEGNWRDIFQNWDALSLSFPRFLPSFIAKFVNASTVDGFNPYRLSRSGFEWEVPDPDDPWSCIGYWGDHQVAYLLRFLETLQAYAPGTLAQMAGEQVFAYADVPYRIAPYSRIVQNPRDTIDYDLEHAESVFQRIEEIGSDGGLVRDADGGVYHVTLLEKLLVPALSKLSNLVPDGGIWMNTQRPEWNDANNALAGFGLSVVTLCYLRRYLTAVDRLVQTLEEDRRGREWRVSVEVVDWLRGISEALRPSDDEPDARAYSCTSRRELLDRLGASFEQYRHRVYEAGFSGQSVLDLEEVRVLCRRGRTIIDRSIRANRREDGLYHSYNILEFAPDGGIEIRRLPEMLEGQVAVLNSGLVEPNEASVIVARLFSSRLFSPEKGTFLLYPDRRLPSFLERNVVPEQDADTIPLLTGLLEAGDELLVLRDAEGVVRFHADLSRLVDVEVRLDELARKAQWTDAVTRDRGAVRDLFDRVFGHSSYTGRSGAMYGFEGLGCVYWHMVSKLLLAVADQATAAVESNRRESTSDKRGRDSTMERVGHESTMESVGHESTAKRLIEGYYRIRSGFGYERSARDFGAFPTDPYSHTPRNGGAAQPGMTGQVKEDILTRFRELGVQVEDGRLSFRPVLLRRSELASGGGNFEYFGVDGETRTLAVPKRGLAFTLCQVPVVYEDADRPWIRLTHSNGEVTQTDGTTLGEETSQAVFGRDGSVTRIHVGVPSSALR